MIEVPYWWNRKYESLAASIYRKRPDLFSEKQMGTTIPPSLIESQKYLSKNQFSIFSHFF
jgi:hypothetical protein